MHTPGPWEVTESAGRNNHGVSAAGKRICSINSNSPLSRAERDANAAIIAAAPGMAKALKNSADALTFVLSCMSDDEPFKRKVEATRDAALAALPRNQEPPR